MAPMIFHSFPGVDYIIPMVALLAGQLLFIFPPILNKKLPDTFEEATNLKDGAKGCCTF